MGQYIIKHWQDNKETKTQHDSLNGTDITINYWLLK